jgi:pilus assembly protein CpaC
MRIMRFLARAALVAAELTGLWLAVGAIAHAAMPVPQPVAATAPDADNPTLVQPQPGIVDRHHRGSRIAVRHPNSLPIAPALAGTAEPPATLLAAAPVVGALAANDAAQPKPEAPMPPVGPLVAQPPPLAPSPGVHVSGAQPAASPISLEAGNGRVVVLDQDAANVFVADPKVAEVRPASANALFVFGVAPGRTTVAAMDAGGRMLAQFTVSVHQSGFAAAEAGAEIARLMPGDKIDVEPQAKGLLLTGSVATAGEAARAAAIAHGYLGDNQVIENQIAIGAQVQITLRVRIAEMSRTITRALGVNWQAAARLGATSAGPFTAGIVTANALSSLITNTPTTATAGIPDANAMIDALAQDNLVRILAEPNLTVMSGEPASFLAGGEFPIPVGVQNNVVTIVFKQYGVSLTFVPTVLSDGRINLHVNPEVSELTTAGAVSMPSGTNQTITVPALTVRRADTTVELGSGQSFAIAGLLQKGSVQNDTGVPGLGDVPILGALFRSDSFQRNESELVIVVTPYVVRPVSDPSQLALPTDGTEPAGDFSRILHLRQIAATDTGVPARIPGQAGFIVQ